MLRRHVIAACQLWPSDDQHHPDSMKRNTPTNLFMPTSVDDFCNL